MGHTEGPLLNSRLRIRFALNLNLPLRVTGSTVIPSAQNPVP